MRRSSIDQWRRSCDLSQVLPSFLACYQVSSSMLCNFTGVPSYMDVHIAWCPLQQAGKQAHVAVPVFHNHRCHSLTGGYCYHVE